VPPVPSLLPPSPSPPSLPPSLPPYPLRLVEVDEGVPQRLEAVETADVGDAVEGDAHRHLGGREGGREGGRQREGVELRREEDSMLREEGKEGGRKEGETEGGREGGGEGGREGGRDLELSGGKIDVGDHLSDWVLD
jgi:hypothetical protein